MYKHKWLRGVVVALIVGTTTFWVWPKERELLSAVSPDGTWSVALRVSGHFLRAYLVAKDTSGRIVADKYVNSFDMIEDISYDIFCTNEEGGVGFGPRNTDKDWRRRYVIITKPE